VCGEGGGGEILSQGPHELQSGMRVLHPPPPSSSPLLEGAVLSVGQPIKKQSEYSDSGRVYLREEVKIKRFQDLLLSPVGKSKPAHFK
jgi:hypothetical protein